MQQMPPNYGAQPQYPQQPPQYPPQMSPVHKGYGPAIAWLVAWFIAHSLTVLFFVLVITIPLGCITFLAGIAFLIMAFIAFMQA